MDRLATPIAQRPIQSLRTLQRSLQGRPAQFGNKRLVTLENAGIQPTLWKTCNSTQSAVSIITSRDSEKRKSSYNSRILRSNGNPFLVSLDRFTSADLTIASKTRSLVPGVVRTRCERSNGQTDPPAFEPMYRVRSTQHQIVKSRSGAWS